MEENVPGLMSSVLVKGQSGRQTLMMRRTYHSWGWLSVILQSTQHVLEWSTHKLGRTEDRLILRRNLVCHEDDVEGFRIIVCFTKQWIMGKYVHVVNVTLLLGVNFSCFRMYWIPWQTSGTNLETKVQILVNRKEILNKTIVLTDAALVVYNFSCIIVYNRHRVIMLKRKIH